VSDRRRAWRPNLVSVEQDLPHDAVRLRDPAAERSSPAVANLAETQLVHHSAVTRVHESLNTLVADPRVKVELRHSKEL
jgi:hypothetical protein